MRHLARDNTVLYVETIGIRHPRLTSHDAGRAIEKLRKGLAGLRHVENGLSVWSPLTIPYHGLPLVPRLNSAYLTFAVRRLGRRLALRDPIVWTYLPNAVDTIERLSVSKVVYHCIDDYGEFTDAPADAFRRMERRMLGLADLTVVSSKRLLELRGPDARRIAYIPHGVNLDEMTQWASVAAACPDIDALPRPRAGFVGRIADWIDLELIAECARELPDWSFVLVGPSNVDLAPLLSLANVHWLGRKEHRDVPRYISRFDVCLMPFRANRVVDSVNPLKMYEYLALGKPVVSVPMREVDDFAHVVTIAPRDEFPAAIRAALDPGEAKRCARIESVASLSWADVADRILDLLDHLQQTPSEPPESRTSSSTAADR